MLDLSRTKQLLAAASALTLLAAAPGHFTQALAQDSLPEIIVVTPSPVVRAPARRARPVQARAVRPARSRPAPAPAPSPEAESGSAEPFVAPEAFAPDSIPGALIVDDDSFVPVTVVTEREILAEGGQTITDSLQNRPGISGTTFAPGANRPIIRGLDSYRIRVQENGIGSHDVAALSEDHAVPIDPFAADRIEVVRGPATLRYGSQAIGGVVAIENQRVPNAIPQNGASIDMLGGLSSVDEGRDGAFKMTAGGGPLAFHVDGFARRADDYDTPRGREENSFVESEGFSGGGSLIGRDGFIGLAYTSIDSLYGIPGEEALEAAPRIDLEQEKILSRGEWRPNRGGVAAIRYWFGVSDYAHDELVREGHGHGEEEGGEEGGEEEGEGHAEEEGEGGFAVGNRFTNEEVEGRVEVQHLPFGTALGELSGAIGAQIIDRKTQGQSFEGDSLLEPAKTESVAGFIFEELQASQRLRLQAAGRIEHTEVDGFQRLSPLDPSDPVVGVARDFDPASASLGALYDLNHGIVARLTGQYVERAPDVGELFSKGIHEATGTFELGNPDLAIEEARTIEFGLKRAAGRLRFDASAYYTEYDGFIFKQLTGVSCGETLDSCGAEDELDQVLFSQRDATFHGAELAAQYDAFALGRGTAGFDGQYDFVRARFDDGTNVPRIPPHRLGGGIFWRSAGWFARAGVLHAFEQDDIAQEEIVTPGYTLVSAELSHTRLLQKVGDFTPELTIGVKGENLADDEVLNHASFKRREEVLLPGANARLFGRLRF